MEIIGWNLIREVITFSYKSMYPKYIPEDSKVVTTNICSWQLEKAMLDKGSGLLLKHPCCSFLVAMGTNGHYKKHGSNGQLLREVTQDPPI